MKVVIDIDKEYYELMKYEVDVCHNDYKPIVLITEGKPFQKGHGRLIDADELFWDIQTDEQMRLGEHLAWVKERIDNAQTIIEADKTESEE